MKRTVSLRDLAPLKNTTSRPLEVQDQSHQEDPTIEKSLPRDFGEDGMLTKEPRVSLRRMQIPRDFVVQNKRKEDAGINETVHILFGRRIQFPKKYTEDFEIEQ